MKRIRFIRHGKLAAPYDDYSKLSYTQLCDLATHKVSPGISQSNYLLVDGNKNSFEDVDIIMCSDSNRSVKTAQLIKNLLNRNIEINLNPLLREVFFDPSKLTTEEKYLQNGMNEIRISLFKGMHSGQGAESISSVFERIYNLEKFLLENKYNNILCISHSFYMRFLKLYFDEDIKNYKKVSVQKLMNTIDYSYMEGFDAVI